MQKLILISCVAAIMKTPSLEIKGCNMILHWQKNDVTSYIILAKTNHHSFQLFASDISPAKSSLQFNVDELLKPPFSLQQDGRVCFKIGGKRHLSKEVCNEERLNVDCLEKCKSEVPAVPVIRHRYDNTVTVAWNKLKGVLLYTIHTENNGSWRQLAVTKSHFFNIQ